MQFTKMHGWGNDYIIIDCFKNTVEEPCNLAKVLCNRSYGIGGLGIVLILPARKADFTIRIYNSDGIVGDMCGNAVCCAGKYVFEHGLTAKKELRIDTLSGLKVLELTTENGKVTDITVDMGIAVFTPLNFLDKSEEIATRKIESGDIAMYEESIELEEEVYNMTLLSMSEPHAVIFVTELSRVNVEKVGIAIGEDPRFQNKTNIEFVQIIDRNNIQIRVWDRDGYEVFNCGKGFCASMAAGRIKGLLAEEVSIAIDDGELRAYYIDATKHVLLKGSVNEIFEGTIRC